MYTQTETSFVERKRSKKIKGRTSYKKVKENHLYSRRKKALFLFRVFLEYNTIGKRVSISIAKA